MSYSRWSDTCDWHTFYSNFSTKKKAGQILSICRPDPPSYENYTYSEVLEFVKNPESMCRICGCDTKEDVKFLLKIMRRFIKNVTERYIRQK